MHKLDIDLSELTEDGIELIQHALTAAVTLGRHEFSLSIVQQELEWLRESFRILLDGHRHRKMEAAWSLLGYARQHDDMWTWDLLTAVYEAVPWADEILPEAAFEILGIPVPPEFADEGQAPASGSVDGEGQ